MCVHVDTLNQTHSKSNTNRTLFRGADQINIIPFITIQNIKDCAPTCLYLQGAVSEKFCVHEIKEKLIWTQIGQDCRIPCFLFLYENQDSHQVDGGHLEDVKALLFDKLQAVENVQSSKYSTLTSLPVQYHRIL